MFLFFFIVDQSSHSLSAWFVVSASGVSAAVRRRRAARAALRAALCLEFPDGGDRALLLAKSKRGVTDSTGEVRPLLEPADVLITTRILSGTTAAKSVERDGEKSGEEGWVRRGEGEERRGERSRLLLQFSPTRPPSPERRNWSTRDFPISEI